MDITQALKDTENSLRDFIGLGLRKNFGHDWIERSGVSPDRIKVWRERKNTESRRQGAGVVEERLLYYADFYDIRTILQKNWGRMKELPDALGEWKTIEVWLNELEKLRDPDAHRRELLPHQKSLAVGIAGEIRIRLIRYRSKLETVEGYFPKIESARDCLGNIWTQEAGGGGDTGMCLRVGDRIDYVVTAIDPYGEALDYCVLPPNRPRSWQDRNTLSWEVGDDQVGKGIVVFLYIVSRRKHHAREYWDDGVAFVYDVLPQRV